MLIYSYTENSLLQAIVHRTKEGRIHMRKNKMNEADQTNTLQKDQMKDQNDFIMLPTVDFCFKELMQNKKVRKGMIAAILHVRPDEPVFGDFERIRADAIC